QRVRAPARPSSTAVSQEFSMTSHLTRSALSFALVTTLAVLHHGPATAVTKVWVANTGSDGNPCTLASPCATFQRAHDTVAAGGEVGVLNAGDYGGVASPRLQIGKSVSIVNDGSGEATILNTDPTDAAVFVLAGVGDIVSLRGLVLDGLGTGLVGLDSNQVHALHVQNCVIRNFEARGTSHRMFMTANSSTQSLFMSDSLVYNNGSGGSSTGLFLSAQGTGSLRAVLNRMRIENNVIGLQAQSFSGPGTMRITVRNSTVSGNVSDGIRAAVGSGAGTGMMGERTTVVNNVGNGLISTGTHAVILLSDSTISKNGTGVSTTGGGQLISYGNNRNNNNIGAEGVATSMLGLF